MSFHYALHSEVPLIGNGALVDSPQITVELCTNTSETFEDIIDLRHRYSNGPAHDVYDEYSSHYALRIDGKLAVALRVTRAHQGNLECQSFYPEPLISVFGNITGSAGRLCADLELKSRPTFVKQIIATAWAHQVRHGARIDIINARREMSAFYQRLNYQPLVGMSFNHPRTGRVHDVFYLLASPQCRGYLGQVFGWINDVSLDELRSALAPYTQNSPVLATGEVSPQIYG